MKRLSLLFVVAAATAVVGSVANADLVMDIRAIGTDNPAGITISLDGKLVRLLPGATGNVFLGTYATLENFIDDGISTNDYLINAAGSILAGSAATPRQVLGNLGSGHLVTGVWDASGSGPGQVLDLNGDGYSDIGSNNNADTGTKFIWARSVLTGQGYFDTVNGALIHTSTYSVTSAVVSGDEQVINWRPRANTSSLQYSSNANWAENFVQGSVPTISGNPATGRYRGGADLVLMTLVPEPSTLLLAAAGLIGVLACAWRKQK
jgi:hypothetical protein